jgi:hypothetical protein
MFVNNIMSYSASYTADSTFTSTYAPSDGTPSFVEINGTTLRISQKSTIPTSSYTGTVGEIRYDSDYLYVCVDNGSWKRIALSTW